MSDWSETPRIGGTEIVVKMVESLIAAGINGLPGNWRDDLHSPAPGLCIAQWLYNACGPQWLTYASRAASRAIRIDYSDRYNLQGPDLAALRREYDRLVRLIERGSSHYAA